MATWLLEVYFCALPVTYRTSNTFKVIEVFPDVRPRGLWWDDSTVPSNVDGCRGRSRYEYFGPFRRLA